MEVVSGDNWTTGATSRAKLQSNHHHQQTNIQFFYRPDALPVAQPTVSKHWREKYHIPWTCLPQGHLGSSNFVSDHSISMVNKDVYINSSWLPWGRVAMPLISPLMPVLNDHLLTVWNIIKGSTIPKAVINTQHSDYNHSEKSNQFFSVQNI